MTQFMAEQVGQKDGELFVFEIEPEDEDEEGKK